MIHTDEERTCPIKTRVTEDTHEVLLDLSRRTGIPVSEIVSDVIALYLRMMAVQAQNEGLKTTMSKPAEA